MPVRAKTTFALRSSIDLSSISDQPTFLTCMASKRMLSSEATIEGLPDDLWKQEVQMWERESWAQFQIAIAQYAIGPKVSDDLSDRYWSKPETDGEKSLCAAMKMKKSGGFA
jgi:hypothetical protein